MLKELRGARIESQKRSEKITIPGFGVTTGSTTEYRVVLADGRATKWHFEPRYCDADLTELLGRPIVRSDVTALVKAQKRPRR